MENDSEATMIDLNRAAQVISDCWQDGTVIDSLGADSPTTPADGYAVQALLAQLRNETVVGWKIAATAEAGRQHINVDRPLAGRLYESIVFGNGARVALGANRMGVAEAEIVLMLGRDLPPQDSPYDEEQVAGAIASVHPGLELPDSRFSDFTRVGAACLIADNACARQFVIGDAAAGPVDLASLADHRTALFINGQQATSGQGSDALGGPLTALAWIANTLSELGLTLRAGQFVTTGVTGLPSPVLCGDTVRADLGSLGSVTATLE
ncbi:MAG: fumarylacetoacetate hydrolase family protein [Burkholderiaceae bacterium]